MKPLEIDPNPNGPTDARKKVRKRRPPRLERHEERAVVGIDFNHVFLRNRLHADTSERIDSHENPFLRIGPHVAANEVKVLRNHIFIQRPFLARIGPWPRLVDSIALT